MSDFLIHAARLQDAGVTSLWVSLGTDKDRTRLMHVSPDATVPRELAAKYPTRTFTLAGEDEKLQALKDDMVYSDDGATPEKLMAAIEAHPLAADDLREWFADWLGMNRADASEVAAEEVPEADVERSMQYVRGVMRGLDAGKSRAAIKKP